MSLLNKASLIMTPNAVKQSKVYSIVPTNGDGDLTFTRGTNASATLSGANGLIELVPYNLLTFSEQFDNVTFWQNQIGGTGVNPTRTPNTVLSPNGTLTADTIIFNRGVGNTSTDQSVIFQGVTIISPLTDYTFSLWVKASTIGDVGKQVFIRCGGNGVQTAFILTINWVRIQVSTNITSVGSCYIGSRGGVTTDNIVSVDLWGAQLNQGLTAKDYFFTTDRLNVPRLNYDVAGGCPSLLLEPQRTNLLLNSVWAGGGSLPTSWTATFATGTSTPIASIKNPSVTAYRFVTSTQRQVFSQAFSFVINSFTTLSVYVESVTTAINANQLLVIDGTGVGTPVYLKNNIAITASTPIEAGNTYSLQFNCTTAGSFSCKVGCGVSSNIIGDITLSMPQLEQGASTPTPIAAYSTSFIPTTTGAVTRNADASSKTGITDLIGQTEGVMFIESAALFNDLTNRRISISDGTLANRLILFYNSTSNTITLASVSANSTIVSGISYIIDTTQFAKIAIRYSNTLGYSLWVNGVNRISSSSTTLPIGMNRLGFDSGSGSEVFFAKVKQVQLYKTYLSNAEMAALTTL